MTLLLLKITLVFAAALVAIRLMKHARASLRHLVLASAFACAAALPVAAALLPSIDIEVRAAIKPQPVAGMTQPPPAGRATAPLSPGDRGGRAARPEGNVTVRWSPAAVPAAIWAAGAALCLARLAWAVLALRRLRRHAIPSLPLASAVRRIAASRQRPDVHVVAVHESLVSPLTCGMSRHALLFPSDAEAWKDDELEAAIVHELEHVRRRDWIVQVLAHGICAVCWFHPLAWVARRHLRLEAERACDDAVVEVRDGADYAEQLIALARRLKGGSMQVSLGMASRSELSTRVAAVLDEHQRRGRVGAGWIAGACAVSAAMLLALAPVNAVAAPEAAAFEAPAAEAQRPTRRSGASLYRAASRGDVEWMSQLIAEGADVNATKEGDGSPLIAAARAGHTAAVKLLLERGADPNLAVKGDGNPLIMAARGGHAEIVQLLLQRGARIEDVVEGDENALIQASAQGQLAVVRMLIERRADVNARVWVELSLGNTSGEWRTPLSMARRGGHTAVVQALLAAGARE